MKRRSYRISLNGSKMNTENKIDSLIAKCFSGEINSSEKAEVNSWLQESDENKQYFQQLYNVWNSTHPAFDPSTIDVNAALETVSRKIKNNKRQHHVSIKVMWQRVAAILILPLMLFMGYYMINNKKDLANVNFREVISPYGSRLKVDLPDGSVVWLNSGSKLKYPTAFNKGERDVYLSGEAYFQVHSDKSNPFIVSTDKAKVKATGTAFNVESYSTDTIVAVTLIHGKVDVKIKGEEPIVLHPNQRLCFNSISNTYRLTDEDANKWAGWKDGILIFKDDRLDIIFKRIGIYYNVDFDIKDKELAAQHYRATFNNKSLAEILRVLKLTAPVKYKMIIANDTVKSNKGRKIEVYKN